MSDTPFIDSLPEFKRKYVAKFVRVPRPQYFDSRLERAKEGVTGTDSSLQVDSTFSPNVQITKDMEAALILMSKEDKSNLIGLLANFINKTQPEDELEFMSEVLVTRADSYIRVSEDLTTEINGNVIQSFEKTRLKILDMLINTPVTNEDGTKDEETLGDGPTAVLIPDLSKLFGAITSSISDFSKPEILSVHDRIVDELTLSYYTNAGLNRKKELSSWINVIQTYLTQ